MKKLLLALLLIALSGNVQISFSWDSTAAKFFPLAIGNRWVYEHYWYWSGITKLSVSVIDSLITNGHKYFKLKSQIPPPGSGYSESFVRVDSITGTIRYLTTTGGSCPWLNNETTGDSLGARRLDTFYISCNSSWKLNQDTIVNLWGIQRRVKAFSDNPSPPNWSKYRREYVMGIGKVLNGFWYQPGVTNWSELVGCVINGVLYGDTNTLVGINQISSEIPNNFSLSQNYPNPFNPATNIKFQIPKTRLVKLVVYDALGKEVQTLVNQQLGAGTYSVDFDGSNLSSGVYYYRIETGSFTETKKMLIVK